MKKYKHIQTDGELFEAVQLSGIFKDSKTFPDMIPTGRSEQIFNDYKRQKESPEFDLEAFIEKNFTSLKGAFSNFHADKNRPMEEHISALWEHLYRKADQETSAESTLIPLQYPYVVPGGRFTEIYYWDSYFTAEGLAAAGKTDMVENMAKNFASLIDRFGHIPNGSRLYYLSRSQPPFFCQLVDILARYKGISSIQFYIPFIEKEYKFWMDGERAIHVGGNSRLNRYWDNDPAPRIESFKEDVHLSEKVRDKTALYRNIRAACESGWDFSSRWLEDETNLDTIRTTELLPVDLNCLLYNMEIKLSEWLLKSGEILKSGQYRFSAETRKALIGKFFWNEEKKFFFDYCFTEKHQTGAWTLAAVYPLFFKIASKEQAEYVADNISEKFLFEGGLATTTNETSHQWDKPNGWAPLQWMAVIGLANYGHHDLAEEISNRFIATARKVYSRTGRMMEKYNVCDMTLEAGGGEYPLQDGFGWTNGVVTALQKMMK